MKKYNVLIETQDEQLFLFPIKAESYKQANALVMRESMNQPFLDGVEISTIGGYHRKEITMSNFKTADIYNFRQLF
ncbi:hypothetical protein, partial [Enterococcus avium]|uniref:hypothetical protein n=1 Tax=Enterococcus avium TaxID=33945 RepID=UPI00289170E8